MDWHKLQHTLFALDPTDPREDLAKLTAAAQGSASAPAQETVDYLQESAEVPQGSLGLDKDYSVADFAALAGVKLTEAPEPAAAPMDNTQMQKTGMGAKMVGNKLGAKGSAGMMGKALDKVAQGGALPANLAKQIAPFAKSLETILGNPQLRQRFMTLINQAKNVQGENVEEEQKTGSAGQAKGKDPMPKKSKPSSTGEQPHPLKDKLVGEDWRAAWQAGKDNYNKLSLLKRGADAMQDPSSTDNKEQPGKPDSNASATKRNVNSLDQLSKGDSFKDDKGMVWYYNPREKNWRSKNRRQTVSAEQGFKMWMQSQSPRRRFAQEGSNERKIKPRDPSAQYMNDLRKSGAMGAHKDKKKDMKAGKTKHKSQQYDSIKEELWARLNGTHKP